MRIDGVELVRLGMPLRRPFRTSFGTQEHRDVLLVRVEGDADGTATIGWGECVAGDEPRYSSEYVAGAAYVIEHFFLPVLASHPDVTAAGVAPALAVFDGHPMAKAAVEMAVLDAELRAAGTSLASHLGAVRDRVPAGVSVGITETVDGLLDQVAGYVADGYVRVKLKIEPGLDIARVAAVRERFGDQLPLQVDANAAYTLADADHLAQLDAFGLLLVEQPLASNDLRHHALLAERMRTPICLDESIVSAKAAADAIALGSCSIVNVKAGRVGGYLEATRVHDVCQVHGLPVWCGGMLETGLGRAANVALAALPNFTLPGDTSASDRYWVEDVTEPFVLEEDGHLRVPDGPGLGREPIPEVLSAVTTASVWIPLSSAAR
jgi:o-succinylbenzoate synthase